MGHQPGHCPRCGKSTTTAGPCYQCLSRYAPETEVVQHSMGEVAETNEPHFTHDQVDEMLGKDMPESHGKALWDLQKFHSALYHATGFQVGNVHMRKIGESWYLGETSNPRTGGPLPFWEAIGLAYEWCSEPTQ